MRTKERFQLTLRWVCFALLLTATVLRLASQITPARAREGLQSLWDSLQPAQQTEPSDVRTSEAPTETAFPTMLYVLPTVQGEPEESASAVAISNSAGVTFDAEALFAQPLPFDGSVDGPLVLIVHTHASEAYEGTEDYHTEDIQYNVVRVGQALAERLNANGIETLHDTTLNDVPGYNDAYERTAAVISGYLEQYPSIQMVIDVHRDAILDADGTELALTAELDGASCARLLLVMGTDAGGLEHPNWQQNLSVALKLQAHCERVCPGLFREMSLRSGRYNEHFTPCSMLLEVGAAGNTLEEALRSAEFFADRLTELLLDQR